jgi:hypothetical protein
MSLPCTTPVIFLIFRRPDLTALVFEAIRQAQPRKLLVVADGPRNDEEIKLCQQAREVTEQVDWDCEVLRNYSDANLGCRKRVSSGLDWAFEQVEEAIVLEDDCLPVPSFFDFCTLLLEYYRQDERIMMISGNNFRVNQPIVAESYFFSRYYPVWGWATWKRAWNKYDICMGKWEELRSDKQLMYIYSQKYLFDKITSMFDLAYNNQIDSWAIPWFYSCLFNNSLCIIPSVNLVSNIGITGTHSTGKSRNQCLPTFSLDISNIRHPKLVFANHLYDKEFFKENFSTKNKSFGERLKFLLALLKKH